MTTRTTSRRLLTIAVTFTVIGVVMLLLMCWLTFFNPNDGIDPTTPLITVEFLPSPEPTPESP